MLETLKVLVIVCITFNLVQCVHRTKTSNSKSAMANSAAILVDPDIYKKVPFLDNSKAPMPYLSMNIDFSGVNEIRKRLEIQEKLTLQHRGEAHITVISPPEYEQLKKVLSMELINEVALLNRIQETPFQIVCLGRGQKTEGTKTLSTFFIVVDAPELRVLRQTIATLYKTSGGIANEFKPEGYYPHITVGFSERDLHSQDGVIKNKATCFSEIWLKAQ